MSFDSAIEALDYIASLPKGEREKARLSNTLIEGIYDKRGNLEEGLFEWKVKV